MIFERKSNFKKFINEIYKSREKSNDEYHGRVIFLDYDGVVNTKFWKDDNGNIKEMLFDPSTGKVNNIEAVKILNKLCIEMNADIVVTSSWRKFLNYKECLYNSGLDEKVKIIGRTNVEDKPRYELIKDYLISHPNIYSFVILDDMEVMDILDKFLVKCDINVGFTNDKMKEAKMILDNNII